MQTASSLLHRRAGSLQRRAISLDISGSKLVGPRQMKPVPAAQQHIEGPASSTVSTATVEAAQRHGTVPWRGLHHVAVLCADLDKSMQFYQGILGLDINPDRPDDKLPYPGSWLWIGPDMVHLMQLPNPDPLEGRPAHGGRDRHFCAGAADITPLMERLDAAGIKYTMSKSGRRAIFFRDPDANTIEVVEMDSWR